MFVRLWMTQHVEAIGPGESLHEAQQRMEAGDFRRLPVVENEKLIGLLTQHDLERLGAAQAGDRVRDHMLTDLITTGPYQPLEVAAALMREHKLGALPVVHKERLVGILTQSDILDAVIKFMSGRSRDVARVTFDMKADFEHLHQAMDLLESHGLGLQSFVAHVHGAEAGRIIVGLRIMGRRIEELVDALWKGDFRVLQVLLPGEVSQVE